MGQQYYKRDGGGFFVRKSTCWILAVSLVDKAVPGEGI